VINSGGLTAIYNISYTREQQFHEIGIGNMSDLMKIDEERINSRLVSRFGNTPGVAELFRMKCHASSIGHRKPVLFGNEDELNELVLSPLLILDLEYDPEGIIWLIGLCVKGSGVVRYEQYFAENAKLEEERKLLDSLVDIKNKYPGHLLITYSGTSADMPQLENCCTRHGVSPRIYSAIVSNHVDLYRVLIHNLRFPIASMGLSDMEEYLNLPRKSDIGSGLEALMLYDRYLRTKNENKKKELRNELCTYNKDDVTSTLSIIESIPRFLTEAVRV
jgi:predicted RecB family nuclease